ncbi:unnamed protein product [Sphenostylis stenocarpa]|uniref:Uncharacterized protein n=1 Tax=Sphenostylis stenocarpa TaxID=92480 RepID=A0AA86VXD9_9FABA|nr:unnamed protein product [Sphenostylis stenocarpa]
MAEFPCLKTPFIEANAPSMNNWKPKWHSKVLTSEGLQQGSVGRTTSNRPGESPRKSLEKAGKYGHSQNLIHKPQIRKYS